ncbi:MAG: phenylacetate--CoA ligase family protein, partial [Thermoplasmatales archaeon]|nr:phenylacetate--CoA ligase family protein [Thermoplasmatales archaeon]
MNPFYNPIFLSKILKSYLFDINRLRRLDDQQLKRFQDKKFKKIVEFAYTVPLYYEKYKKAGIHPRDISGLKDIEKLPFITKQDIKKYYPDGIISKNKRKDQLVEVSTSGTTGKSLSIFVDMFDVVMGLFGYLRTIREYDLNWRKSKLTIIGDFASHTAESGYINKGLQPRVSSNFIFKNIQWLDTNADPKENLEKINKFKPDFIGGYVGMLGHMALLKEQGLGKDVNPKVIAATGSVLDADLRNYIEQSFHAKLYEVYGATETGPIAFECKDGGYHVMSDLLHLEFFNNNEPVTSADAGKLVVTKLFGRGTPIIRYDAINDIVAPTDKKCTCG